MTNNHKGCLSCVSGMRTTVVFRSGALLFMVIAGIVSTGFHAPAQPSAKPDSAKAAADSESVDKYLWLEDVHSKRAMDWVKAENERSAAILEKDPRYSELEAKALAALESPQRLPTPDLNDKDVYNTWQDAQHQLGILRRTSIDDYLTSTPHWQTVLDYDALAKQDNQRWVQKGRSCLYPGNELCLIALSAGGEDASSMREFNLRTGKFVDSGFQVPRSKQSVEWVDKDTLLVARDWGPGTMTKSGYPFVVKLWKRGQPLDQATEVYRGAQTDESGTGGFILHDALGHQVTVLRRGVTFFDTEFSMLEPQGVRRIALPVKADISGLLNGQLIVSLDQDWTPEAGERKFVQGSVLALNLADVKKDSVHLKPSIIFAPTSTEFVQGADVTRNHLLLTTLENAQGRAYVYTQDVGSGWERKKLDVPLNSSVKVASTNWSDDRFFLSLESFLTPPSLLLGDAEAGTLLPAKTVAPQFDATDDVVEQFEATSRDGTKVPYFVVRPKNMNYDGTHPTLLTAYGGFEISMTPFYSATLGKLWLEKGGVFVLANIRGGAEFGPAWHTAGLKTHRQSIYDDFAAVGQDLVTRHITSPRRLGIEGGSNGGLLMGVEMTQHPAMWNAIGIMIPLLDMLRYEQIAAGASWVGEYGSVKNPEERAFLASISPYHQLKADVTYPEPLIFTTTKDDRVGPVHARKFAAKMEELQKPFLYQEITEGGHGAGADLKEQAKTLALTYTYFTRKLMD